MKLIPTILFLFVISCVSVSAQNFSATDNQIIADSIDNLFAKYVDYHNLAADDGSFDKNKELKFKSLFSSNSSTELYNDLVPDDSLQDNTSEEDKSHAAESLSLDKYVSFLAKNYKKGMHAEVSNIEQLASTIKSLKGSKNGYTVYLTVNKKLVGLLANTKIYRWNGLLYVQITFKKDDYAVSDFKIERIISSERYAYLIKAEKWRGNYMGVGGGFNNTRIVFNNFTTDEYNFLEIAPQMSSQFSFEYRRMTRPKFGFSTGVNYKKAKYNINIDTVLESDPMFDENNRQIIRFLEMREYSSEYTLTSVSIPFTLHFAFGSGNNAGVFFCMGVELGSILKETQNISGHVNHDGHYPFNNNLVYENTEYHYEQEEVINDENQFFANINFGLDVSFFIKNKILNSIYPWVSLSVSNYTTEFGGIEENYADVFLKTQTGNLFSTGLTYKIYYKL